MDFGTGDAGALAGTPLYLAAGCIVRLVTTAGVAVDRQRLPSAWFGAWSHVGTRVLAATSIATTRLWLLEHEGGIPARRPISSDVFWGLSVSPDGRELRFWQSAADGGVLRGLSQPR